MVQTTEFRVEIKFDEKPSEGILTGLKVCGWKWDSQKCCWFNKKNDENLTMAYSIDESLSAKKAAQNGFVKPSVKVDMSTIIVRANGFFVMQIIW